MSASRWKTRLLTTRGELSKQCPHVYFSNRNGMENNSFWSLFLWTLCLGVRRLKKRRFCIAIRRLASYDAHRKRWSICFHGTCPCFVPVVSSNGPWRYAVSCWVWLFHRMFLNCWQATVLWTQYQSRTYADSWLDISKECSTLRSRLPPWTYCLTSTRRRSLFFCTTWWAILTYCIAITPSIIILRKNENSVSVMVWLFENFLKT